MLKVNFQPNEKHFADIEKWLSAEWNETNQGFYSNWRMISEAFDKKKLIVITVNDYSVGFVVYKIYELTAVIDITEIKQSERKKGIAKKLINETLDLFKSKGVLVTELFCSPENSEPFWKRIGFLNFPKLPDESQINMYKTLAETLQFSQENENETSIKLWNCEPYQAKNVEPKWIWNLSFLNDGKTLTKPIIFPADIDWQIALTKNGETVVSHKLKYCGFVEAVYGSFMIIRELSI